MKLSNAGLDINADAANGAALPVEVNGEKAQIPAGGSKEFAFEEVTPLR